MSAYNYFLPKLKILPVDVTCLYLGKDQISFDCGPDLQVLPVVRVLKVARKLSDVRVPFVLQEFAANKHLQLPLVWLKALSLLVVGQMGPNVRANCYRKERLIL